MRPRSFLLLFALMAALFLVVFSSTEVDADEATEYYNPEIELKFNLKEEDDALSPQNKLPGEAEATKTVQADYDYIGPGIKIGREPVHVGTWTSDPVEFDVNISVNSFDVWWEDTEDSDDSCEWTITIEHNGESVSEDISDCQHDGEELARGSHNLNTIINLVAGDTIGIDLVFEGWDDIRIHYDNVTYDTGLNVKGNHLIIFGDRWENTIVTMEFTEAWPTDWNTNLDAEYVLVMGVNDYMADNAKASVRDGNKHTFQGNNSTMEVNSTVIEWTEINGTGLKIMMDYTVFDHMGNSSANGTLSHPIVTLILEKIEPPPSPWNSNDKPSEEEKCVHGDTKTAGDGCNQCVCSDEEWICTEVDCDPDDSDDGFLPAPSLAAAVAAVAVIALRRRR